MTISDAGSIGEILGAIATVATLIYLAIQIRENTALSKRQALEKIIERIVNWGARLNENPELHEIYRDGLRGFGAFDDAKKDRYHLVLAEILMACEAVQEHGKTDSIKPESVDAIDKRIVHELRGEGARTWWIEMGSGFFATDFVDHVDRLLAADQAVVNLKQK